MKKVMFFSQSKGNHGLLLAAFIVIIIATVFRSFTEYANYILYPMWALWLAYIITNTTVLSKNEKAYVIVSFFLLALIFFYRFIGYSQMTSDSLLVMINWIMAGVVSVFALKLFSSNELFTVYISMTIALLLLLFLFASAGRVLINAGDDMEAVDVASAWYGSLFVLLAGLSLIVILHVKRLSIRIVAALVLVMTVYLNMVVLQRGTNLILTIIVLALILLFLIKRKSVVITLAIIIALFGVFAFSSDNVVHILEWMAQVSPSERLQMRFNELSMAMAYEDVYAGSGSFASRGELIDISWNTFTSSFGHVLFGAGEHDANNNIIGHHSFFVDTLARYGIIGGVLVFMYFKKQYQIIMSHLDRKKEWALYMQCAIVFAVYIFRNFYGEVSYSLINLVILLYFPLTFQLIHYYSNKNYKIKEL